jgi:transposase-like protein
MAHDKRGISANHLATQIGVSYPTAWLMLHKIRKAMGDRDAMYQLEGIVELDDAFFGAPTEGGKRGRGTEKTKVIVGLSLTPRGNPVNVKMQVVENLKQVTIANFAEQNIKERSIISTDLYRSYRVLSERGYFHSPKEFNAKENPDHLHWLHTVISNAKAFVGGTFHGLDAKHLQAYLNEFCYRFNRRKFENALFYRLLTCCVQSETITYPELT